MSTATSPTAPGSSRRSAPTGRSRRRVQDKLAELLPLTASVLLPPGQHLGDEYEVLGVPSAEVNQFAFTALSRRLKVIGVGLPAVTG